MCLKSRYPDYMQWEGEFYKAVSLPLRGERVFITKKQDDAHRPGQHSFTGTVRAVLQ